MSDKNWVNEEDYRKARASIAKWPLWKRVYASTNLPPYAKPFYTEEELEDAEILQRVGPLI